MQYQFLTDDQIDHFLQHGYIVLHDCFSREVAAEWTDRAFVRLGYDRDDPSTWIEKRIHMPSQQYVDVTEFAPKVWGAACELLGGVERVQQPYRWGDGFILNLCIGADRPWEPPSADVTGWHKDGDFFRHFLDSPEQGLLTLVLWSDIKPRGGGTFVAGDSVAPVARFLAAHPEGVHPYQFDFHALIHECHEFVEMTGQIGDVVLLHPYVLHTVSQNHLGTARLITNPPINLREPMNFNRPNPADFSLVEQAVLRGLGVERLDFTPTAPRERLVPERVHRQQQMLEAEKQRLAAVS